MRIPTDEEFNRWADLFQKGVRLNIDVVQEPQESSVINLLYEKDLEDRVERIAEQSRTEYWVFETMKYMSASIINALISNNVVSPDFSDGHSQDCLRIYDRWDGF